MIENVFTFNGPMACSSAKALVLAHVTRVKKRIVAPLKFPISVFLWLTFTLTPPSGGNFASKNVHQRRHLSTVSQSL